MTPREIEESSRRARIGERREFMHEVIGFVSLVLFIILMLFI